MSDSHTHEHDNDDGGHIEPLELARIGLAGLAIVVTWLRLWQPVPQIDVVGSWQSWFAVTRSSARPLRISRPGP
jgi:hypothetical protein